MAQPNIDPHKFDKEKRQGRILPANKIIRHKFAGGRESYTSGNDFIQVNIDTFNKTEPLEIVEFDMDEGDIAEFMKKPEGQRPKLRLIKAKIKGTRDRLTIDR